MSLYASKASNLSPCKNGIRYFCLCILYLTRPKPVGHGYVFSMAVDTIGKVVPFLLGDEQLILMGRGGQFFKINILAVKHLKINILASVPRKINKKFCIHQIQIGYILK